MPAFTINIPIRTLDANDVKNAFAKAYGYTEVVQVGGVTVPNPITKEEFVKQKCINFMLEITRQHLVQQEQVIAVESAKNSVETRSQEVVGWFDNRRLESVGGMDAFTNFPQVQNFNLTTNKNEPVGFSFSGTDPDNLPLTFMVTIQPENGTVLGINPNLMYIPNNRFIGSDSFKYKANNGTKNSLECTVGINVIRTLTAADNYYTIRKNHSLEINLNAYDNVGSLSFTIIDGVSHGILSGINILSYVPNNDFVGVDFFTFQAQDDLLTSNIGTITLEVVDLIVDTHVFEINKNTELTFLPQALNAVGIPDFSLVNSPNNGVLIYSNGEYTYTPNLNYVGSDTFGFIATDFHGTSAVGTFTVNVNDI